MDVSIVMLSPAVDDGGRWALHPAPSRNRHWPESKCGVSRVTSDCLSISLSGRCGGTLVYMELCMGLQVPGHRR